VGEVTAAVDELTKIAATHHAGLIASCVDRLDLFRLSRQLAVIDHLLPNMD